MAKGGRESLRPSYGRPKLTLILRGKKPKKGVPKSLQAAILTLEQNPPERKFFYMFSFSLRGFGSKVKIEAWRLFGTPFLGFFPLEIRVNFGRPYSIRSYPYLRKPSM